MTRFAFITDTHFGTDHMGYQQQKGYPEHLPTILKALQESIAEQGAVDFVLHGGDMIDFTTEDNIGGGAVLFDFAMPVYLCLGNHDLTTPDAVDTWLDLAPQFFPEHSPNYRIETDDCMIHVVPNHWCDHPHYWEGPQRPRLDPSQMDFLESGLQRMPDLPHLVLTHNSVFGLPPEQTGRDEPMHCPDEAFTDQITSVASRFPQVKCVLGGHNHLNMRLPHKEVDYVTASALVEAPFEFKLFDVSPDQLKMTTLSLEHLIDFEPDYDLERRFVQGRHCDRSIVKKF